MDTTIDSVHGGPLSEAEMIRKTKHNTIFKNNIFPLTFSEYNNNINTVDIGNQERTGWYSTEMDHGCGRWTFRPFQHCDDVSATSTYRIWSLNNNGSTKSVIIVFILP